MAKLKKIWGKVLAFAVAASMAVIPVASVLGADNSTTETVVDTESAAEMEERAESVETEAEGELSETESVANEVEREQETVVTDLETESDTVPGGRVSDVNEEFTVKNTPITAENDSEA